MPRASFHDLTSEQQAQFGNGVGPFWLSGRARNLITGAASWFFRDASWRHHDFGYCVGGDRWDRARCDWKFLVAMLKDAVTQQASGDTIAEEIEAYSKAVIAVGISLLFYVAVRVGGQFGSFEYRNRYATLDEVLETCR